MEGASWHYDSAFVSRANRGYTWSLTAAPACTGEVEHKLMLCVPL